jgi:hypothetical protein
MALFTKLPNKRKVKAFFYSKENNRFFLLLFSFQNKIMTEAKTIALVF